MSRKSVYAEGTVQSAVRFPCDLARILQEAAAKNARIVQLKQQLAELEGVNL